MLLDHPAWMVSQPTFSKVLPAVLGTSVVSTDTSERQLLVLVGVEVCGVSALHFVRSYCVEEDGLA